MERKLAAPTLLAGLAMLLLLAASLAAILLDDGGAPFPYTSLRGETVEIYGGAGPYRYDTTYKAIAFRAFDWANLMLVIPLFAVGIGLYRRGKLRGQLLLLSLYAYLLYIYLIGAMGNAYNALFPLWTALFSVGAFGLCLILRRMDLPAVAVKLARRFLRRSAAVYVSMVGLVLLVQYGAEIIAAYAAGVPPVSLDHYTTLELASLELGFMIPLHFAVGLAAWRGRTWGYLAAAVLAFTAFMVFVALSVSLVLFGILYDRGDPLDTAVTIGLTLVAAGFSGAIFARSGD